MGVLSITMIFFIYITSNCSKFGQCKSLQSGSSVLLPGPSNSWNSSLLYREDDENTLYFDIEVDYRAYAF